MNNKNPVKYTDEELLNYLKEFYIFNKRVPLYNDFANNSPNSTTYKNRFESWSKAIELAGLIKEKQKSSDYTREELINLLKKYYLEFGKVPTTRDLKKENGYPSDSPYRRTFGSYKQALIEAGLFELRKDKNNKIFERKAYSKEELLRCLEEYINKFGHLPTGDEIDNSDDLPSRSAYVTHFGGINNAMRMLGYSPNFEFKIRTDEELLNDIKKLSTELKKTPTSRDIVKSNYCARPNVYIARFGSLYSIYEKLGLSYIKRNRYRSDEEIINTWFEFKSELKRVPIVEELKNHPKKIYYAIFMRWGSYFNFIKDIDQVEEYSKYYKTYITEMGIRCFSYHEYLITSWLENNKIHFQKEVFYRDVLEDDNSLRRFDWVIESNGNVFFVEYFGMQGMESYDVKTENKIEDCIRNGIEIKAIYPSDLKEKSLDEIFSFLYK